MKLAYRRWWRLGVPLAVAALLVGASSAQGAGAARADAPSGTGGYSCPGSVGGRSLEGPTNVAIPGVEVQGDASNDFLVTCSYAGPSSWWAIEVAWTPPGSSSRTFEGCGSVPGRPLATFVSADRWAYAGTNLDEPPAVLAAAARKALTDVEKLASPCVPATGEPTSAGTPPAASTPLPGRPLCDEAVRYYGDTLAQAGVTDPKATRLRTGLAEILTGFAAVITDYDAAHAGAPAHSAVGSTGVTLGAINWLWEVGGLSSKIPGISKLYGNAPTDAFVTHTEPRLAQKIAASSHPLSPAEVFAIALELNKGDVGNALLAAHNTLRALGRGDLVDQELTGVSKADGSLYGTHLADLRSGAENSGPWYHLFGTAYFELVSSLTGKGAELAQAAAFASDDAPAGATAVAAATDHFGGQLPTASALSGWANWAEQRIRARNGSKPDPEKYCLNVWGAQLGAVLAQAMGGTASYASSSFEFDANAGGSEVDVLQSPFSVRWTTPAGTTTLDQTSGTVTFGNALLVYPLAEGGSWGGVFVPPADSSGTVTFVATKAGAELHFLRVNPREAVLYRATAGQAGEEMTLALGTESFGAAMTSSGGESIVPERLNPTTTNVSARTSAGLSPFPDRSGDASSAAAKLAGAGTVLVLLGVGTALLIKRRRNPPSNRVNSP
ncbi:hypothetical protein [Pengzhenrongella sp.]|jgi:hypothetical protein|uniref:hypothetical protein n=1 Tax=Pengzhenrongella sp. TaxID=2888820 RepID=UPI002F940B26